MTVSTEGLVDSVLTSQFLLAKGGNGILKWIKDGNANRHDPDQTSIFIIFTILTVIEEALPDSASLLVILYVYAFIPSVCKVNFPSLISDTSALKWLHAAQHPFKVSTAARARARTPVAALASLLALPRPVPPLSPTTTTS